ncbi:MAG: histidine phosphatase family protein [Erysipelotrichaceae bacterium]|nr:histidine phosphatase family protein [Erysipelotrichaceae bacterium]MDY5251284.1 histidine phosphatase family protein [Erysipelotrichaceae bacterium]
MTKHLYLMRHGETLFNQRHKIQGWCDSPLTAKGIKQAQAAKELLQEINFDHYYCSTSERCSDTLELVTDNKVSYTRLKQLKERNYGYFEGCDEDFIRSNTVDPRHDDIFPRFGGEYDHEVSKRMNEALKIIMEKNDHDTVLAVSHGGACAAFLRSFMDMTPIKETGGLTNCCIIHLEYDNDEFKFIDITRPEIIQ